MDVTSKCLCGSSSFTVRIEQYPIEAHLCHCDTCRHAHGEFAAFHAPWPVPPPESLKTMTGYQSSSSVTRYFCSKCGTQMGDAGAHGHQWTTSTATVDEPEKLFEYKHHIFVPDTKDGGLSDLLPMINGREMRLWRGEKYQSEELPKSWKGAPPAPDPSERLEARCLCGGVKFFITRPDADVGAPIPPREDPDIKKYVSRKGNKWMASNCVCKSCRLASGCDISSWYFVATPFITLEDGAPFRNVFGTGREYCSSENVARVFCSRCGATVLYQNFQRPKMVDISAGILRSKAGARAEDWADWNLGIDYSSEAINASMRDALQQGLSSWGHETG
ncbi:hypothetical protein P152DRAFT_272609 [Eremomyces bilateralis CBS 781.70]|uniref:CENP-V/GFA domain-containing protein n=1 Tax=Eremomyces bilateralis CBS 781.70 TaxID=1392243 RepID=A0A6G1G8Z9_9PEZI|nr:uncharacterized protein P152DRAFT_272609 [Eremomyces bilateralis CBS 781.70]KAF1814462.1 hypothetical protein P152DRAFT_272609 [Eremomyces bilateralis CBS 781.70]